MLPKFQLNCQFSRTLDEIKGELDYFKKKLRNDNSLSNSANKQLNISVQEDYHSSGGYYNPTFRPIDSNIKELLKENANLTEKNCLLQRSLNETKGRHDKFNTEYDNPGKMEHYEAEIALWKENYYTSESQRKEAIEREKKYKDFEAKAQAKIKSMEDLIFSLKEKGNKEKEKIRLFERQNEEFQRTTESIKLQNESLNSQVNSLSIERDNLRGSVRVLEEKLMILSSEFHDFRLRANLINQEKEYLSKENEFFSKQLDEQLREMNELRDSLKNLAEIQSNENLHLKKESSECRNCLMVESGNNSIMRNELNYLQNELFESLETLKMMENELNSEREKSLNHEKDVNAFRSQLSSTRAESRSLVESNKILSEKLITLETELLCLSADHKEVLGRNDKSVIEGTEKFVEQLKVLAEYIDDLDVND